jgi:hypothetical protein
MKITLLFFCLFVSTHSFADSHGGVAISNALFKGVTNYALDEGGDLERVLSVKKILNTNQFEITYGGVDTMGRESNKYKVKVKASIKPDEDGTIWPNGEVQIQEVK